jgi:hypothetical protein
MGCDFLEESIKPDTSLVMIRHLLFTNKHHYGDLPHEETVKKFRGTVAGEFIDFDRMEKLKEAKKAYDEELARRTEIARNTPVSMDYVMKELCGEELYKLMKKGW